MYSHVIKRAGILGSVVGAALTLVAGCGGGSNGGSTNTGKIAFVSTRDGNRQVYVMDADGSNQRRVTVTGGGENFDPSISNNRNRIVFASTRDGNAEIYSIGLDGGGLQRLTNSADDDTQPRFSPDGTKVAWISTVGGSRGSDELWTMNASGSEKSELVPRQVQRLLRCPTWRPDGAALAYIVHTRASGGPDAFGKYEIAVKRLGTGSELTYAAKFVVKNGLRYHPNGNTLAYAEAAGAGSRIFYLDLSDSTITEGPSGNIAGSQISFSPDGTKILFDSADVSGGTPQIYASGTPNGTSMALTNLGSNYSASWGE